MRLYELSNSFTQLLEMADVMDQEVFQDTLQAIEEELESKVENTAKLIRCLEADAKAIKEEEQRLETRRKSIENKIGHIKEYLFNQLTVAGLDKVKRPTITISIQLNNPAVEILDESLIPSDYIIPQPSKIDKKAILTALKDGLIVDGCDLKREKGLRIK